MDKEEPSPAGRGARGKEGVTYRLGDGILKTVTNLVCEVGGSSGNV